MSDVKSQRVRGATLKKTNTTGKEESLSSAENVLSLMHCAECKWTQDDETRKDNASPDMGEHRSSYPGRNYEDVASKNS